MPTLTPGLAAAVSTGAFFAAGFAGSTLAIGFSAAGVSFLGASFFGASLMGLGFGSALANSFFTGAGFSFFGGGGVFVGGWAVEVPCDRFTVTVPGFAALPPFEE